MNKVLSPIERVNRLLSKKDARFRFKEICERAKVKPKQLEDIIAVIREQRPDLMFGKYDKCYWFANTPTWYANQTDLSRKLPREGEIGLITDTHLCSVAERLDLVNYAYDVYAERGIKHVFHMGDVSDGWQEYKGHINFVKVHGDQAQAKYVIQNYPKREGIETWMIGGNHDDSFNKNKVDRLSLVCYGFHHEGKEIKGRADMHYVGQYSHYIIFPDEVRMHMLHPRGNQAYSYSYKQQKRAEAMDRNRQPEIQCSGHFHTFCHIWADGLHSLALPGLQDATEYFTRLGLPRSMGFTVLRYKISKGKIVYFQPELFMEE